MPEGHELAADVGAVIVPEVRAAGTRPGGEPAAARPTKAYLERHPPAGVIVFGRGPAGPVDPGELLRDVRAEVASSGAPVPFACCDLEQGAGLHFAGATRLPPASALSAARAGELARGASDERAAVWVRSAAAITALEARERGVELVLAPVVDVDTAGDAPIVAVRGYGPDLATVAACARAFHEGLARGGAAGAAKHFPGHGSARTDSHLELATLEREGKPWRELDAAAFRAAIEAGVSCVMMGHLDAPTLTGQAGLPASLSSAAIEGCLRGELGFGGVVLSDALDMGALLGLEDVAARALGAGCDGLLAPRDPLATARELVRAVAAGTLRRERLSQAAGRMRALRERLRRAPETFDARGLARAARPGAKAARRARFALEASAAGLILEGGPWPWRRGRPVEVLTPVDPVAGLEARAELNRLRDGLSGGSRPGGVVLPVVCELQAGSGHYGPDAAGRRRIVQKAGALLGLDWPVGILWFGSPGSVPGAGWAPPGVPVLVAHAAAPPVVDAVLEFLRGRARALGCRPGAPG